MQIARIPLSISLSLPLSLCTYTYRPTLQAGPLDYIQCPRWANVCNYSQFG